MRRSLLVVAAGLVVLGCTGLDPRPQGSVIIYGRNAAPGIAWFGLVPADPTQSVGFGRDIGVACLGGAAGTEITSFDGSPGQGGQPKQPLGRVPGAEPAVMWVDVAADGSVTSGVGVPPWWADDDAHPC